MINPRQLAPLCLTLALGAMPLLAQPEQAEPPAGSSAGSTARPAEKTTAPQQAPAAREAAPKSADAAGKTSPFDYRSSEEISEDVPVSFPVDI